MIPGVKHVCFLTDRPRLWGYSNEHVEYNACGHFCARVDNDDLCCECRGLVDARCPICTLEGKT
jgi:hypothetical protein